MPRTTHIHKDELLPIYANYFHALSLTEMRNLFDESKHAVLKPLHPKFEQFINNLLALKDLGVVETEQNNFRIPLNGKLVLPDTSIEGPYPLVLIGHGNAASFYNPNQESVAEKRIEQEKALELLDKQGNAKNLSNNNYEVYSYQGYEVVQEFLSKRGVASYSVNLNLVNFFGNIEQTPFTFAACDFNQRILLLFLHLLSLKLIAGEATDIPSSITDRDYPIQFLTNTGWKKLNEEIFFADMTNDDALVALNVLRDELQGKIDFNKIGFMGHSRGADAVSRVPAYFFKNNLAVEPTFPVNSTLNDIIKKTIEFLGRPSHDIIKCVLALQPTSPVNPDSAANHGYVIDSRETMYYVVSSTHDEDVTLDPVRIYEYPQCPKAMIVIKGATHKRFNFVWRIFKDPLEEIPEVMKGRLVSNRDHDRMSKYILADCLIASLTEHRLFKYTITRDVPLPFPLEVQFQTAWKFGFPFQSNIKVFEPLDNNITERTKERLKDKNYPFEQEDVRAYCIEKDNEGSSTIEIKVDPANQDENLANYSHFSFRFARGYNLGGNPDREEFKNFTIQMFENDTPLGKLILGQDLDNIKLQALRALDFNESTGKRQVEHSILLQTVEVALIDYIHINDLGKINRIEVKVIPDKTKLSPASTASVIVGSLAGAYIGGVFFLSGALIADRVFINGDVNKLIPLGAATVGAVGGAYLVYRDLKAEENVFVFNDFVLTRRDSLL